METLRKMRSRRKGSRGQASQRRRGPPGFARTCSCFSPDLLKRLDAVADAARTPRTVVIRILATEAIRNMDSLVDHPLPHVEKCTRRTDVVLPRPTIKHWRQIGLSRGLLGLSGLLNWTLDAILTRGTVDQLAALVIKRPDLKRIAEWLRRS